MSIRVYTHTPDRSKRAKVVRIGSWLIYAGIITTCGMVWSGVEQVLQFTRKRHG